MHYGKYRRNGVEVTDLGSERGTPRLDTFYYAFGVAKPGKTLLVEVDEVPPILPEAADHTGKSDDDLVAELAALIRTSIRNTPIEAVSLSGGLDSAIVAVVAKPKIVFSCRYPDYDELGHARVVADLIGAEHVIVEPTDVDAQETLPAIVGAVGQPIFPSSAVGNWKLDRAMQEHDVRNAADGTGPDELFGGYIRYLLVCLEHMAVRAPELRGYRHMIQRFWDQTTVNPARRYYDLLRSGGLREGPPYDFVEAEFQAADGLVEAMTRVDLQLEARGFVAMTSGCAREHGIAWHSPLISDEIAAFALGLPDRLKSDPVAALSGKPATKVILRNVARALGVPDQIINRTDKQGWVTPIARWFKGPLAGWVESLCASLAQRGYRPRSDPLRGEFDQSTFADVCLELWLRYHDK